MYNPVNLTASTVFAFFMLPHLELDIGVFPARYSDGRERWLQSLAGQSCQWRLRPYQCPGALGPGGEALVTDSVWLGPENAGRVLVLLSGTHGIEGFVGTGVQIDWLTLLAADAVALPEQTAVLMVHALTPWGYAWLRRCDQDGVDLNRNGVDFTRPLPSNPGYEALRPALFLSDGDQRQTILDEFGRQHGQTALERAISGGQYGDPAGPFYGGRMPAHGRRVCEDLIQYYALAERDLAVIDLHSGLGPFGYGEVICDHLPDSAGTAAARRWYGDSVTLPALGTSSSVPKLGLLDYLWHAVMNDRSCYVTLEFGTYPTRGLFDILLQDHRLWAESGPDTGELRREHARAMRRHFCPDDRAWREMVLFRGRQVIDQALRGSAE